jgi:hypothetical protein
LLGKKMGLEISDLGSSVSTGTPGVDARRDVFATIFGIASAKASDLPRDADRVERSSVETVKKVDRRTALFKASSVSFFSLLNDLSEVIDETMMAGDIKRRDLRQICSKAEIDDHGMAAGALWYRMWHFRHQALQEIVDDFKALEEKVKWTVLSGALQEKRKAVSRGAVPAEIEFEHVPGGEGKAMRMAFISQFGSPLPAPAASPAGKAKGGVAAAAGSVQDASELQTLKKQVQQLSSRLGQQGRTGQQGQPGQQIQPPSPGGGGKGGKGGGKGAVDRSKRQDAQRKVAREMNMKGAGGSSGCCLFCGKGYEAEGRHFIGQCPDITAEQRDTVWQKVNEEEQK